MLPPEGQKSQHKCSNCTFEDPRPTGGSSCSTHGDNVVGEGRERKMGTNKCLVKQLLCLYPFPHFSQRSSGRLLFRPPSFTSGWPSLALLTRAFSKAASASSPDISITSSSIALSLSCRLLVPAPPPTNRRLGRLAGGDGKLPAITDRDKPFLDRVFRRAAIGSGVVISPDSVSAAASAATFAPVFVMLFRRVTRWAPFRALPMTECEWLREWDCRLRERPPGTDVEEDTEGR